MEIERINENTLKFYISYRDIEDRGFKREDIWYNRDKGEQLFWEMMDEVNDRETFNIDGPLWIQVQAMDKGLEIVVTKAEISQDGSKLEFPDGEETPMDTSMNEKIESLIENSVPHKQRKKEAYARGSKRTKTAPEEDEDLNMTVKFDDLEDAISLSHSIRDTRFIEDQFFAKENQYYLYVNFPIGFLSETEQENYISRILEYGEETSETIHLLVEYGTSIFEQNALKQLRETF
ncbi:MULTISPECIES: adaptor protein MecA [Allobacillus]|uniref:Adapter protein MecA n=1 Tax=Allobacillus halotolerans TaxID=570278 RepID=A0ABS6GQW3_9BACI|nr:MULTISPECIES: adaptor protein MecA [Allobacillus]MBU6081497.1 adaptor protein MecA [Allobacillus halotolerans]TSJ63440.1 adaptor protein MecA [Allobacillus sp. SKP2-8]